MTRRRRKEERGKGGLINKHCWVDIPWTNKAARNTGKIGLSNINISSSLYYDVRRLLLNANMVCSVPNVTSDSLNIKLLNLHWSMKHLSNFLRLQVGDSQYW